MSLSDEFAQINTLFIDTAPIIYYIEAHPQFGLLAREVVNAFQSGKITAFSSVITLTEVLPKPIQVKNERLARKFLEFFKYGKNLSVVEISMDIAERAGMLRGRYPDIKALDAIQISAAIDVGADIFVTNDQKLKQISEIKVLVLKDYL
ncbi:MAG: PIN domain-containing protein [Nitrospirae bacterium]|nr:PIN domain-containing protein [Nitrospirota bacterium]